VSNDPLWLELRIWKNCLSSIRERNPNFVQPGAQYETLPPRHLARTLVIVTNNTRHPAYSVKTDNLHILYHKPLNLIDTLYELKNKFRCEKFTIQTGGTLNCIFLREKLIDYLDIVVAPILVGGSS